MIEQFSKASLISPAISRLLLVLEKFFSQGTLALTIGLVGFLYLKRRYAENVTKEK